MSKLYYLFCLLFATCSLFGSNVDPNEYDLTVESIAFKQKKGKPEVHFFLNNSYELFGYFNPDDVKRFVPGTPVAITAYNFQKDSYKLFVNWGWYQVFVAPETLQLLPIITEVEADEGWFKSDYYVTLDDGSKWRANPETKFGKFHRHWKEGDQVIVCHLTKDNYGLINIDADEKFLEGDYYYELRNFLFFRVDD